MYKWKLSLISMCTVKGVAHGNKSTENYQPTLPLPSYLVQQLDHGLMRLRANALVAEHATGVIYAWLTAKEPNVCVKITMAARYKFNWAALASVLSEVKGLFHWEKSNEQHWEMFSTWLTSLKVWFTNWLQRW